MKYNWSDVWLLLTIIYAGSGENKATLGKIISIGDGINHAIFNADELESGLERLTRGRYIKEKDKIFSVTAKVKRAFEKTTTKGRTVEKELKDIQEYLKAAAPTAEQPFANDLKYEGFSYEEFRREVDKYLA